MEVADAREQHPVADEFVDYVVERRATTMPCLCLARAFAQTAIKGWKDWSRQTRAEEPQESQRIGDFVSHPRIKIASRQ